MSFLRIAPLPICLLLIVFSSPSAGAFPPPKAAKPIPAAVPAKAKTPDGKLSVTRHTVKIQGKPFDYVATAGTLPLKTEEGKVQAQVFFVAYTQSGEVDLSRRPVTFCFNGGPGSSSVWLHLGMLGPKRVQIPDNASSPKPPYKLVENQYSLLDRTDLVFIDPVTTGYSRPAKGEKGSQFHGFSEDIESVGRFIHEYVTKYRRWPSPKFLLGESYGTTRAAGLSGYLQDRYKMYLNGIVMVSSVIDFQTLAFGRDNDLPYVLFLPGYTATAWYHKRLPADLQKQDLKQTLKLVEKFAVQEYAPALMKGSALDKKEHKRLVAAYARYTGLSPEYVEQSNLRVSLSRFAKELLRKDRRTIGRFDSRFKGIDRDAAGSRNEYDPSGAAVYGAFGETINGYLRSELKFQSDLPYEVLTGRVRPWNFKQFTNRYVSVSDTLRQAMTENPHLKVFVACGYYDLATPYFASIYSYNHLALDPALRKNLRLAYYRAGHMMYIYGPSLKKLRQDLDVFYSSAAPK
jgi:carboxypeptidase C (cathepsin A)